MTDPVLYTERLVLRPLDAARAQALLTPRANGYPRDDDVMVLQGVLAGGVHAPGSWVVEDAGEPVGTVGCAGALTPDGDQELGYGLVPSARGRGLATEAVGAACAHLERRHGVRRLTAEVQPGNSASMRVLQRLGFVPVAGGSQGHQLLARAAPGLPGLRAQLAGRHVC